MIEKIKLNIKLEEEQEANGLNEQENEHKKKDPQENKSGSEDELSAKNKKHLEEDLDKIGLQNTNDAVSDLREREEPNNKKNFKKLKT